jgi:hypothetical protein
MQAATMRLTAPNLSTVDRRQVAQFLPNPFPKSDSKSMVAGTAHIERRQRRDES